MRAWRCVRAAEVGRLVAGGALVVSLGSCGGGDTPVTPSTPAPTPVAVSYNGTYTGASMTFTGGGYKGFITASVTITQTGSNLSFADMQVTEPFTGWFGLGDAVLDNNTFDATNVYSSSGCGIVTSRYRGYFSGDGNLMNMTVTLTPSMYDENCYDVDVRGEMQR